MLFFHVNSYFLKVPVLKSLEMIFFWGGVFFLSLKTYRYMFTFHTKTWFNVKKCKFVSLLKVLEKTMFLFFIVLLNVSGIMFSIF